MYRFYKSYKGVLSTRFLCEAFWYRKGNKMDNLVIRKVKVEDLRNVAEIVVNGWQTAYKGIVEDDYLENLSIDEKYQKMLKNYKEDGFIVAEQNNKIVGFCRYCEENKYIKEYPEVDCELCALYVKNEEKRKGIGSKLVKYVMNEFKNKNLKKMIIWCFKDNYKARNFYEKMDGSYCGESSWVRGNKEYKKVGYVYNLQK